MTNTNFTPTAGMGNAIANPDPNAIPWSRFHHDGQDSGISPNAGDLADTVGWKEKGKKRGQASFVRSLVRG